MEKLLKILQEVRPDVDFEKEKLLIDNRILDSFDIISIVSELNDVFDIYINASELLPENFNSVEAMMKLVNELKNR